MPPRPPPSSRGGSPSGSAPAASGRRSGSRRPGSACGRAARSCAEMATAEIGVFGGSGFYSFLERVETVEVETPHGSPSAPLAVGEVGGKRVAFLPRHGVEHELPPHRIPYRANVWAMRELGVRRI